MDSYVLDLAKRRKTTRRFSSRPIDLKQIIAALEAACQAPSGANSQPWRFLIVTDPKVKRRVREACENGEKAFYSKVKGELGKWLLAKGLNWQKPFLEEAPVLVLIFSETKAPYAIQSAWLAIGHILLALEESGLGTITYTPSITRRVTEEIDLPKGFRLEAILPVGISVDEKPKEPKFGLRQVAYLNSWGHRLDATALLSGTVSR